MAERPRELESFVGGEVGFDGVSSEPTARILPKEEARRIYNQIVAKLKDPALLEFVGYNLIRSSVFPVQPGATQKVQLTYERLLARDGDRIDYILPRSESIEYSVPWTISVELKSRQPISTVYSPSHHVETTRKDKGHISVRLATSAQRQPGPFRLSYLLEQGEVSASLLAYPDVKAKTRLKHIMCGGEAVPASLQKDVAECLDGANLHDLYGPTETTIHVTHWWCRDDDHRRKQWCAYKHNLKLTVNARTITPLNLYAAAGDELLVCQKGTE